MAESNVIERLTADLAALHGELSGPQQASGSCVKVAPTRFDISGRLRFLLGCRGIREVRRGIHSIRDPRRRRTPAQADNGQ